MMDLSFCDDMVFAFGIRSRIGIGKRGFLNYDSAGVSKIQHKVCDGYIVYHWTAGQSRLGKRNLRYEI